MGERGVQQEWSAGGALWKGGAAESTQVGVKTMTSEEFKRWFLDLLKHREREVLAKLVESEVRDSLVFLSVFPLQ